MTLTNSHAARSLGNLIFRPETLNAFLRFSTVGAKGILIFFMAVRLSSVDVGHYGLIAGITSYLSFVYGLDFYSYTTRLYVGSDRATKIKAFANHGLLSGVMYVSLLFPVFILTYDQLSSFKLSVFAIVIAILEHLSLESQRYYNYSFRPMYASLILFLRAGLWPIFCIILIILGFSESLTSILVMWLFGLFVALAVAAAPVRHGIRACLRESVDLPWIWRGVQVATPLLIGTLAIRAFFSLDRLLVARFDDPQLLASYVLYASVVSAVLSIVDAGVVAYKYPLALLAASKSDYKGVSLQARQILVQGGLAAGGLSFAAFIVVLVLAHLIGKPSYSADWPMFLVMLSAGILYVIGQGPQTVLFALKRDRQAIIANWFGLLLFLISSYMLGSVFERLSVAFSACVGLGAIWLLKAHWSGRALRECRKNG